MRDGGGAVLVDQVAGIERSSENGAFSGWGASRAMVWAYTQPDPGVALKPPVPQPQLKYSPGPGSC